MNGRTLRVATDHLSYDEFTKAASTSGIAAAVEALGTVARTVNSVLATLAAITDAGHQRPAHP